MAERFDVENVKSKMAEIEAVFEQFANTLKQLNDYVETSINVSPDSAVYGDVGGRTLQIWDSNASTFGDFHANFESWAQVISLISASNQEFTNAAVMAYKDTAGTLDGIEGAREYISNNYKKTSASAFSDLSEDSQRVLLNASLEKNGVTSSKNEDGVTEFKDAKGNVIATYKDGVYYDADGKKIGNVEEYKKWIEKKYTSSSDEKVIELPVKAEFSSLADAKKMDGVETSELENGCTSAKWEKDGYKYEAIYDSDGNLVGYKKYYADAPEHSTSYYGPNGETKSESEFTQMVRSAQSTSDSSTGLADGDTLKGLKPDETLSNDTKNVYTYYDKDGNMHVVVTDKEGNIVGQAITDASNKTVFYDSNGEKCASYSDYKDQLDKGLGSSQSTETQETANTDIPSDYLTTSKNGSVSSLDNHVKSVSWKKDGMNYIAYYDENNNLIGYKKYDSINPSLPSTYYNSKGDVVTESVFTKDVQSKQSITNNTNTIGNKSDIPANANRDLSRSDRDVYTYYDKDGSRHVVVTSKSGEIIGQSIIDVNGKQSLYDVSGKKYDNYADYTKQMNEKLGNSVDTSSAKKKVTDPVNLTSGDHVNIANKEVSYYGSLQQNDGSTLDLFYDKDGVYYQNDGKLTALTDSFGNNVTNVNDFVAEQKNGYLAYAGNTVISENEVSSSVQYNDASVAPEVTGTRDNILLNTNSSVPTATYEMKDSLANAKTGENVNGCDVVVASNMSDFKEYSNETCVIIPKGTHVEWDKDRWHNGHDFPEDKNTYLYYDKYSKGYRIGDEYGNIDVDEKIYDLDGFNLTAGKFEPANKE